MQFFSSILHTLTGNGRRIMLALTMLCILCFGNTLMNEVAFDDSLIMTEPVKKGLSAIREIFTTKEANSTDPIKIVYRPIRQLTLAADYQFFGGSLPWMHAHNVLWMIAFVLLAFLTFRRLFPRNEKLIAAALALFITMPVHAEVVANIKSRDELIAAALGMASLYMYIRYEENKKWYHLMAALLLIMTGMLSKLDAITYLGMWPVVWYYKNERLKPAGISKALAGFTLLFFIVALSTKIQKILVGKPLEKETADVGAIGNVLHLANGYLDALPTKLYLLLLYLRNMIWPTELVYYSGYNQIPLLGYNNGWFYIALVVWIIAIAFALREGWRRSIAGFGLLFFFCHYTAMSQLIKLGPDTMADRFIFNSSLGYCVALAAGIGWAINKYKDKIKILPQAILLVSVLAAGFYFTLTLQRNAVWKNDWTLFSGDMPKLENCMKANFLYANTLTQKSMREKNEQQHKEEITSRFRKAISLMPAMALNYYYLASAQNVCKDREAAYTTLAEGMMQNKDAAILPYFRAEMAYNEGKYEEAIQDFELARIKDKKSYGAYRYLAWCYLKKNDMASAMTILNEGIEKFPDNAMFYLEKSKLYLTQQNYAEMVAWAEKAIDKKPDYIEAYDLLGQYYAKAGNRERAEYYYLKIKSLQGKKP